MRFMKAIGVAALCLALLPSPVKAADYNWQKEGKTVDLGDQLASFKVPAGMAFLDAKDTVEFNKKIGNPPTGNEIGMVLPTAQNADWFVIFEYTKTGHIKDDEKADLNADKLLESFKNGDKESNKQREKLGAPALFTLGWDEPPHYDTRTRNLTWSLLLQDGKGEKTVNKNIRLLGRDGYVSATLVTGQGETASLNPQLTEILNNFSYKQGHRYEDYNPKTDKLAEYGLTALIAGGAGVAASKAGLFAGILLALKKFGIIVFAVLVGIGNWLKKKFNKKTDPITTTPESTVPESSVQSL